MGRLKVMFLCTGNSCRSQMAEGFARRLRGDAVEAYSAGVEPHGMNPRAMAVMREAGVPIDEQRSKHVDELAGVAFDYVVTVCGHANETCPVFPGKTKVLHVGFDDPPRLAQGAKSEEEALGHYRRVRDEIRAFVETLPGGLEQSGEEVMSGKPIVLVLCTGNSCRSQMAAGFLRHFAGDRFEVRSAGTHPKPQVHPLAVRVMGEVGIDVGSETPTDLTEYLGRAPVRHLLVVCDKAQGTCPTTWPGAYTREFMPFDDPAEFEGTPLETLAEFRRVRDEIGAAMKQWEPKLQRVGR